MKNRSLIKNGLVFVAASFFVGVLFFLNPVQANKADALSGNSDELTESMAKERNISTEEATERSGWADRASEMNDKLISKKIEAFGGVWVNASNDRIVVGVVEGREGRDEIDAYVRQYDLESAVDYKNVDNSFQDLLVARQSVIDSVKNVMSEDSDGYTIGIITDQNKVLLRYSQTDIDKHASEARMLSRIVESESKTVKTEVTPGKFELLSCNWWFCDSALRGGVGIKGYSSSSDAADALIDCTAGFGVVGNSGTKYILTAGHCEIAPSPQRHYWRTSDSGYTNKNVGWVHRNVLAEGTEIDGMIIELDDIGTWSAAGKVYVRAGIGLGGFSGPSTDEDYDITAYTTSGSLVNNRVCTSGAKSADLNNYEGGSCGPVKEVLTYKPDLGAGLGPFDGLVRAHLCSRSGDSGAPVFRTGKALGVITGRLDAPQGCSENVLYTGIKPIIDAFDDTIDVY